MTRYPLKTKEDCVEYMRKVCELYKRDDCDDVYQTLHTCLLDLMGEEYDSDE